MATCIFLVARWVFQIPIRGDVSALFLATFFNYLVPFVGKVTIDFALDEGGEGVRGGEGDADTTGRRLRAWRLGGTPPSDEPDESPHPVPSPVG